MRIEIDCSEAYGDILSTDQQVIPAGNVMDAHAQDFVVSDKLLVPILKPFSRTLAQ
jgi:hypothetical protein